MIVGVSEETSWRCEVIAGADGYVVQLRDLDTSEVEDPQPMLFRTPVAAFAYGDFLSALRRTAAARLCDEDTADLEAELEERRHAFGAVAEHLADSGVEASLLAAWADFEERRPQRRLH
jgi:hypothetical protein